MTVENRRKPESFLYHAAYGLRRIANRQVTFASDLILLIDLKLAHLLFTIPKKIHGGDLRLQETRQKVHLNQRVLYLL